MSPTIFESPQVDNNIKLELVGNTSVWYLLVKTATTDCLQSYFMFDIFEKAIDFARDKYQVNRWKSRDGVSFQNLL